MNLHLIRMQSPPRTMTRSVNGVQGKESGVNTNSIRGNRNDNDKDGCSRRTSTFFNSSDVVEVKYVNESSKSRYTTMKKHERGVWS